MAATFHKYYVTNGSTKARVRYSPSLHINGRKMITLYEKDYGNNLPKVFNGVQNDTDVMTDYFEDNRYRIFEGDPRYESLLADLRKWGIAR